MADQFTLSPQSQQHLVLLSVSLQEFDHSFLAKLLVFSLKPDKGLGWAQAYL
jgi:hypothetical protein